MGTQFSKKATQQTVKQPSCSNRSQNLTESFQVKKNSILPSLKSKNYILSDTSTCGVLNNARGDRGKLDIRDVRPS